MLLLCVGLYLTQHLGEVLGAGVRAPFNICNKVDVPYQALSVLEAFFHQDLSPAQLVIRDNYPDFSQAFQIFDAREQAEIQLVLRESAKRTQCEN